ncbi:hypothetical protein ACFSM7_00525 [Clavibacter michiganensis subsp. tessellarius]|uniref:hypothetical protein n=1 Tax=Clavibacter tessellarius TaxID=31965 RepID=UPI00363BEEFF
MTPEDWYFTRHFHRDPVQPGSLGIESMLQALQVLVLEAGLADGIPDPRLRLATGVTTTWSYRGQVGTTDAECSVEVGVTRVDRTPGRSPWSPTARSGRATCASTRSPGSRSASRAARTTTSTTCTTRTTPTTTSTRRSTMTDPWGWSGPGRPATSADALERAIHDVARPVFVVETPEGVAVATDGALSATPRHRLLAAAGPVDPEASDRRRSAKTTASAPRRWPGPWRAASRPSLVSALARAGHLASYGAAGQLPERIDEAVRRIREAAPGRPFAVNVIHSPSEAALEEGVVDVLLHRDVRLVEASAYLELTHEPLVRYRLTGAHRDGQGRVRGRNRVIAKVSRPETARLFLAPAPEALVRRLRDRGAITEEEAALAPSLPMADDITVEADSGGHTDRRPLLPLLSSILVLRDRLAPGLGTTPRWAPREGWGRRTPSPRRSRWAPSTW